MIFPIGQDILIREGSSLTILGMNLFVILRQGKDFTFTLRIGTNQSEHHYTTARRAGVVHFTLRIVMLQVSQR